MGALQLQTCLLHAILQHAAIQRLTYLLLGDNVLLRLLQKLLLGSIFYNGAGRELTL